MDLVSRGQMISAVIAGAYHFISGKRHSATRVCAAHARRARVCIAFEGNIVLGTVGHGHPRGVRHPPALRGARERASARRRRRYRLLGDVCTFR